MGRNAVLIPNEQTNGSAANIFSKKRKLINYVSCVAYPQRAVTPTQQNIEIQVKLKM